MKIISSAIWIGIFIALLGFVLKNDQMVTLQYFFGYAQAAPFALFLFAFFLLGVALTILAMIPIVFRHKRDISKHKKAIAAIESERIAEQRLTMQGPQPDSIRNT